MAQFKSAIAMALESSIHIRASAIVANIRMTQAFVDIDASISRTIQRVSTSANTLETAFQISTFAMQTNSLLLVTFVNI